MGGETRQTTRNAASSSPPQLGKTPGYLELQPRLGTKMIERAGLVARLLDCDSPLVVLSAHAGAGKTTVLVQWVSSDPRPHAWLQLEQAHNDPLALVDDIASVLRRVAAVDSSVHRWTHLSSPPMRERILPALRSSLAEAPPFVLVLDDAHVLDQKVCWDIIETLFESFPAGGQLAIGTRSEPLLPLARTEAAGQLLQLDGRELAFSLEETKELLHVCGLEADEATIAALQKWTEGWPAGLSLATLACKPDCTHEWISSVDGRQRNIARYLTSEVLDRQRSSVRKFLLETSILYRLSDGSCRAVTGRTDSGRLLAKLSRENVFLVSLDDREEWYRYHHLFAKLLRAELERRDGARVPELHRRAAVWAEEYGDLEGAVRHWLAAGEVEKAGDAVCLGHGVYSTSGHADTVSRWLELFSKDQIFGHVQLAMVAGMVRAMSRRDSHPEWTAAALNAAADDGSASDDATRMWKKLCRAFLAPEGAKAMREDAELFVRLGAGCHPAWRAPGYLYLAGACWATGDMAGAEEAYRRAIDDAHQVNLSAEIAAISYLSLLHADQGRWEEAQVESERARQRFEESELGMDELSMTVPLAEMRVAAHSGSTVSQEQFDSMETDMADFRLPCWIELTLCLSLAQVSLDVGRLARAERWIERGESIIEVWPDAIAFEQRAEELRRALSERRRVEALTPAEKRVLELLATHLKLPEIARRLTVSPNTVKTHVRDLYRKLGAHSRTSAVERAKRLSLLKG